MAAPKRPLAKPDQDKPKYIDPFVYGDSGRRITISPGTNPITQLGQTTGSEFREYEDDDLNIRGMYLPPQTVNEIEYEGGDAPPESRSAQFFAEKHPDKDPLQMDDIMITLKGVENNQTAIHEFMHRGFERLRNAYDRDEVESRFGRSVANILFEPDYEHYLVQSVLEDEGIESTNNYTEGVTKSSKEKLTKTVAALNELASDEMGMLGFQTEKDSGPKTRPKRKPKKEKKSFFKRLFNFSEGGDVSPLKPKARPRTKTEEKTLRGRPVWIDHTGEVTGEKGTRYSEISTTIPWGTEWITAPSVDKNGKRLSDDEVKQKLIDTLGRDFITGEKLPTFSNQEKAVEYAQWRSDTMFDQEAIEQGFPEEFPMGPEPERKDLIDRSIDKGKDFLEYLTTPSKHGVFNKGGAVMNEQMEMAFMQEGGLQDDGMDQDPVSGNEVPSGSMASEVRDDISAQLSEGEYVVPADVVRFFGVKFFEDLRAEAKMGLQTMEANGRIGGEPVDEPMQDEGEMSDEEFEQLIRQELGSMQMAEGGMVPDMNEDYEVESSAPVAFNEGGYEPGKGDTSFNPFSYIGLGSTLTPGYVPPPEVGTESPAESESSCAARGLIYNPNTKMCDVPQKKSSDNEETGSDVEDYTPKKPEVDYFKLDEESLKALGTGEEKDVFGNKVLKATGVMMSGPITLALGAFSAAKQGQSIAQLRAAAKVAEVRGLKDTAKLLNTRADTLVGNSSPLIQGLDDLNLLTGNNYFADQVNSFGAEAELSRDDIALGGLGKDRTDKEFRKLMEDSAPKGMVYKPGEGYTRRGSLLPDASPRPKTRPSGDSSNNDGPSAAQIAQAAAAKNQTPGTSDTYVGRTDSSGKKSGETGYKSALKERQEAKSFEKSTGAGVTQDQKDRESAAFGALNKGGLMKKKRKK